jgi:DNA-binding SARP family transcriptional activator
MTTAVRFRLRVLGGISVERLDQRGTAEPVQRSNLATLALLTVAGNRGLTRDKLLAYRWPESTLEHSRNALSQVLFVIRRTLGADSIIQNGSTLRLNPDVVASDLKEFEDSCEARAYETAVAVYGGPFLDGFHLSDAPEFERWVDVERARLNRDYADVLKRLAIAADKKADSPEAIGWWKRLAVVDPLSGVVAAALMKSLAAAGDRAAALQHGQLFETRVHEELGAAPDPVVLEVSAAIRLGATRSGSNPDEGQPGSPSTEARSDVVPPVEVQPLSTNGETSAAQRSAPARRIGRLVATAGALALMLFIAGRITWARAHSALDPHRVIVASIPTTGRNVASDPIDALLRERLGDGVTETHLASVVPGASTIIPIAAGRPVPQVEQARALARENHARYLVAATYNTDAESLLVRVQLVDAESGNLVAAIEPVRGARNAPRAAIELLRSRVMAALAARLDPKLEHWSYAAAMPTTYESYRELRLGIDAFVADEFSEATSHFERSAALDTSSATPLVWAAWALAYHRFWPQVEVLVPTIKSSGRKFGAWDHAVMDVVDAWLAGDLSTGHAAGHRLAAVVPNSEWSFPLAWDAGNLGRSREALRTLHAMDPESGWLRGFPWYWWTLANAYHSLGDHAAELRMAREGKRREPTSRSFMQLETRALAALGRVREVRERCVSARAVRSNAMFSGAECWFAVVELRAHGYRRAARELADVVIAELAALPDSERVHWPPNAVIYYDAGNVAAYDSVLRLQPSVPQTPSERALTAAARGDRAGVRQALREVAVAPPPPRWPRDQRTADVMTPEGETLTCFRAQVAALLGDREEAVSWLSAAFREGNWDRRLVHADQRFDGLRGYPPFEALVRPPEVPEVPPPGRGPR